MFEIGWTEMLVIAIVMIVVVGPKDLPRMLRTFGKTVAKLRGMAGDFQKQFNEALKEAELDDVKKSIDDIRGLNPINDIKKNLNPFEKAAADVRAGLDMALKPSTAEPPAADAVHAAEPLKAGAANMPGVAAPEAVPAPPPELVSTAPIPVSGPVTPEPSTKASAPGAKKTVSAKASKPDTAKAPVLAKPTVRARSAVAAAPAVAAVKTAAKPVVKPVSAKAAVSTKPAAAKPAKPVARSAATAKSGGANGVGRPGSAK